MVAPAPAEDSTPAAVAQEATVVDTTATPVAEAKELPQTASQLPLIMLLGLSSLGAALVLKRFSN
jgi:LPXTG-motif cell wall-anchored protein